jgi:hypothetical protein
MNNQSDLRILKTSEISLLREEILLEQDGKCAICKCEMTETSGASLDHQHKTQKETIGANGAGLIRGVLCRNCNVMEGKIWNNSKRFGMHDNIKEWLISLVEYLDKPNYDIVHPTEKPKEPKVSKRNFNLLIKKIKTDSSYKKKLPEYPKYSKLGKELKMLFELYNISPYN